MYFPVLDLWWLIIHVPSEWILLYQPQQSQCQLRLLLRSTWCWPVLLSHRVAKRKNECICHLHGWRAFRLRAQTPGQIGCPLTGWATLQGFFGKVEGKNAKCSYTQKCWYPPSPAVIQALWVSCDISVCLGSKSCQLQNTLEIQIENWGEEEPSSVWKAVCL